MSSPTPSQTDMHQIKRIAATDLSKIKGEYDASIKEDRLFLETNQDFTMHGEIFAELQKQRLEEALKKTDRPSVRNALQASINQTAPVERVDVEARGLQLLGNKQIGDLDANRTQLLEDAGRLTEQQRAARITDYNEQVDALAGSGVGQLDFRAAQKLKDSFKIEMEKKTVADIESLIVEDASGTFQLLKGGVFDDLPILRLRAVLTLSKPFGVLESAN